MVSWTAIGIGLLAGSALGLFFFGGLWWTVQRLPGARRPFLYSFASFAVRAVITLGGFYLVALGSWERLLGCLIGFLVIRMVLMKWLTPARDHKKQQTLSGKE